MWLGAKILIRYRGGAGFLAEGSRRPMTLYSRSCEQKTFHQDTQRGLAGLRRRLLTPEFTFRDTEEPQKGDRGPTSVCTPDKLTPPQMGALGLGAHCQNPRASFCFSHTGLTCISLKKINKIGKVTTKRCPDNLIFTKSNRFVLEDTPEFSEIKPSETTDARLSAALLT